MKTIFVLLIIAVCLAACGDFNNDIQKSDLPSNTDQTIITLGGFWIPNEIHREVTAFNNENQTYQIQIRDYYTPEDVRIGILSFQTELITGKGPDIILHGDPNVHWLYSDLYTFLDADPILNRADFFPNILQAMEGFDGTLPMITSTFGIETIVGVSNYIEYVESWNFAKLLKILEDTDLSYPMGTWLTGTNFIYQALWFTDDFINFDENRADLENPAFIDLLETAALLPDDTPKAIRTGGAELVQMHRGMQLLHMQEIFSPGDFQEIYAVLGDPVFPGIPNNKSAGHMIHPIGSGMMGINAESNYQEEAWGFIRRFLLPDAEIPDYGFPLRIDLYEALITEAVTPMIKKEGDLWYDDFDVGEEIPKVIVSYEEGFQIKLFAMTTEESVRLRTLIESAGLTSRYDETIMNIINDELPQFFAGDRTAAITAQVLQNRIQMYLNERQ